MAPIPKWLQIRYSMIWKQTRGESFTHEEARKFLRLSIGLTSAVLSALKAAGWLIVEIDPTDSRKRTYRVISPEEAVEKMRE